MPDPSITAQAASLVRDVEHELGVLLRQVTRSAFEPDTGLDRAAFSLLLVLSEVEPARVSDVANAGGLDVSTVSRAMASMTERGLVAREPDPADRRACLLRLSADGRERLERARAARRAHLRAVLADWPGDDLADLARLLHRLTSTAAALAAASTAAAAPVSPAPTPTAGARTATPSGDRS